MRPLGLACLVLLSVSALPVTNTHAAKPVPKLPFTVGEAWILTRAYNDETHTNSDQYALDFTLSGCNAWAKPIRAMAGGTVSIQTYDPDGYGSHLLLIHGDGYSTRYAHLNSIAVTNGQYVSQGETVGYCGNSGWAEGSACPEHPGTHVHVAMYHNGAAENMEPVSGYSDLNSKVGQSLTSDNTAAVFSATYTDQTPTDPSGILHLVPNEVVSCSFTFTNAGTADWSNNGTSQNYVELHAVNSARTQDQSSVLAWNWIDGSSTKIATISAGTVSTGGTGTFPFTIKTPSTPGTYVLYVSVYHPNGSVFISPSGPQITIDVVAPLHPCYTLVLRNPSTGDWYARVSNETGFVYPSGPNSPADKWLADWAAENGGYTFTPYVGDPNGDGYDDLLVWRNDAAWYVAWNNGDGSFTAQGAPILPQWGTGAYPGKYHFFVVDLTDDGKDELLTFDAPNGTWYVCTFSQGTNQYGTGSLWLTWGAAPIGTLTPLVGDWNGDGKTDLCLRNPSTGDHWVRLSTGNGFFQPSPDNWEPGWGASSVFTQLVGDWNGDGKDDLLLRNSATGDHWVRLSNGSDFTQPSPDNWCPGWGASSVFSAFVGDFDDDGDTDLGLRNTTTGDHWVRFSNSSAFMQPSPDNWCPGWLGTASSQLLVGRFGGEPGSSKPSQWPGDGLPAPAPKVFRVTHFPSPVRQLLTVSYTLPAPGPVAVTIFDIAGRQVATLCDSPFSPGTGIVLWDASSVPAGLYFLRVRTPAMARTRKIVVLH